MSGKQLFISLIVLCVFVSFKSSQEARKPGREAKNLGVTLNPAVGTTQYARLSPQFCRTGLSSC